jgi:hypothetical protein
VRCNFRAVSTPQIAIARWVRRHGLVEYLVAARLHCVNK